MHVRFNLMPVKGLEKFKVLISLALWVQTTIEFRSVSICRIDRLSTNLATYRLISRFNPSFRRGFNGSYDTFAWSMPSPHPIPAFGERKSVGNKYQFKLTLRNTHLYVDRWYHHVQHLRKGISDPWPVWKMARHRSRSLPFACSRLRASGCPCVLP